MSQSAIQWAAEHPVDGPAKSVLLILAVHANAEARCWPSVTRIAEQAGVCERTARIALRRLEKAGAIETEAQRMPARRRPVYRLLVSPVIGLPMPRQQGRLPLLQSLRGGMASCG